MSFKFSRFALCVDVWDGVCMIVYEDDLNAIEVRAEFSGARIGHWYRFELSEDGHQSWQEVNERLPTKRIEQKIGKKRKEQIQVSLPIFYLPTVSGFDCAGNIGLYSPRLKSPVKVSANVERLIGFGIKEAEQCHAFLTFNFVASGNAIRLPQWSLDSVEDIQKDGATHFVQLGLPPPLPSSATGKPTEWGILLKVDYPANPNSRMGSILCLRDGKIAQGRILPLRENTWSADEGDTVAFSSIDVANYSPESVRLAFNVLSWKHHNWQTNERLENDSVLLALETDSEFHCASTMAIASSKGSENETDIFDLQSVSDTNTLIVDVDDPKTAVKQQEEEEEGKRRRFLPSQQAQQQQQQVPENRPLEGIGVFTHAKADKMFWRFYDEPTQRFTHLVSITRKKVMDSLPEHTKPKPGEWFHMSYRKHKTPQSIELLFIRRETKLCILPLYLANSHLWHVWIYEKLMEHKLDEVKLAPEELADGRENNELVVR